MSALDLDTQTECLETCSQWCIHKSSLPCLWCCELTARVKKLCRGQLTAQMGDLTELPCDRWQLRTMKKWDLSYEISSKQKFRSIFFLNLFVCSDPPDSCENPQQCRVPHNCLQQQPPDSCTSPPPVTSLTQLYSHRAKLTPHVDCCLPLPNPSSPQVQQMRCCSTGILREQEIN